MLDINLNWYKTFLTVADSKSLSDASSKLNISSPAISKTIKQLEEFLGTILFYRENDGMRLTAGGKDFYNYIVKAFDNIEAGEKLLLQKNDMDTGEIVIGCQSHIGSFYLMDAIEKVNQDYPQLKIKIVSDANAQELLQQLCNHKIDFSINSTQFNIDSEDFVKEKIKEIPNIFISKNPLEIKHIKELENLTYILPFEYTSIAKKLKDFFERNDMVIKSKKEMEATELRIKATEKDIGVGYVMKDAVEDKLMSHELYEVKLPKGFELPSTVVNLIYLKGQLPKVSKKFIEEYLEIK